MPADMIAGERPARLAILGHPVAHSLSPVFQGAALAACGLPVTYDRIDVPPDRLDAVLETCRVERIGGNITIPHKEAVAARAAHLSDVARRAGAVNTFWFEGGALYGHNTDVDGARATLQALRGAQGRSPAHVVVLGSGGSAAAVLLALAQLGAPRITIIARTIARARALHTRLGVDATVIAAGDEVRATVHDDAQTREEDRTGRHAARDALGHADLVVNTTPLGLRDDDPLPVDPGFIAAGATVFDLVYRGNVQPGAPQGTAWIRAARARGLAGEDGLRMLVEQGAAAFETWFGLGAPRAAMWDALGVAMPSPDRPRV